MVTLYSSTAEIFPGGLYAGIQIDIHRLLGVKAGLNNDLEQEAFKKEFERDPDESWAFRYHGT
ncbi:hypothetical protein Dda_2471 [Drechslerella dactyloides]|uniref:Uncharacterized protein n=1 Tax=Drechslerella dactyloides TaxID=74499 RepID=A0AAD6IZK0_DREDA|nr:hypothetical protein Dda_2471 [Drechslerella dactyloides]